MRKHPIFEPAFSKIKDTPPQSGMCLLVVCLCVEIRATKFHIPVMAFSISSCELETYNRIIDDRNARTQFKIHDLT